MTSEPARTADRGAGTLLAWLLGGWVALAAAVAALAAWVLAR